MKVVILDAYDSFVYTLYYYLRCLKIEAQIYPINTITIDKIPLQEHDCLVLGPGPGHPSDATLYHECLQYFANTHPILGICLGHQVIAQYYGAKIIHAPTLKHGKTSLVQHDQHGCFTQLSTPLTATRYHSLAIDPHHRPSPLQITATAQDDDCIMAIRHQTLRIEGLQFHPESIGTEQGVILLDTFLQWVRAPGKCPEYHKPVKSVVF